MHFAKRLRRGLELTFCRKAVVEIVSVNAAALLVAVVRAAGDLRLPTIRGEFGRRVGNRLSCSISLQRHHPILTCAEGLLLKLLVRLLLTDTTVHHAKT